MKILHCFKLICIILFLCHMFVTSSLAQRKVKKTKKTGGSVDGKWRPMNRKPPARKPAQKPGTGQTNKKAREFISPVLRRFKGEAPLQRPSWIHCINNIQASGNWATIRNSGYEEGIFGQLQCTWIFYGTPGMRLRISFETMDLQKSENGNCNSQFVDVIDLEVQKSQGRFCGSRIPGDYVTEGSELRLDIQADISPLHHKGFMASVRVEPASVQPGMRDRSLRGHDPVTEAPTTRPRTRIVIRRRPTTPNPATRRVKSNVVPTNNQQEPYGENLYGQNHQPQRIKEDEKPTNGALPMYAYILIAVGCIFILMLGTAYVFRRSLIKRVKEIRGTKETFENEKEQPRHNDDDYYYDNHQRFAIPEEMTSYNTALNGRRRRSVIFEDEYLAAVEREQQSRDVNMMSMNPGLRRSQSLTNIYDKNPHFQGWDYPYSDPVYDEDRQSVRSVDSVRSSMRHPDHEEYKKMKLLERSNSLRRNDDDEMTPYNPGRPQPNNPGYYDDTINLHRQQGAIMMQQLGNVGISHSMNDISNLDDDNLHKPRAVSMAEIPVEGSLLKRQMSRRQSFHM